MRQVADAIERIFDYGGMRKDICVLAVSAVSLIASLVLINDDLLFDPAWIAVFLCGTPIVVKAVIGLVFRFDIKADVLVSIALVASIYIGEIFAAGEVAAIMMIGGILEEHTSERANREIGKLMDMRPKTARIISNGEETMVCADEVKIGDTVRVLAGESIPVDGVITKGTTSIDQSMMTGEPITADKTVGDAVLSGTVNQFGVFEMRATKTSDESTLERMIDLIERTDAEKAPIVRCADRWATWIVVICLSASLITYLVTKDLVRAVTVLVVFCPCAFILATPTAVIAAIGNATRHGCLIRSGSSMELLAKTDTITFDKTGTITYGTPSVSSVISVSGIPKDEIFRLCAIAEKVSEHPLGKAIVRSYGRPVDDPSDFQLIPGKGVICNAEGHRIVAGNSAMMDYNGISTTGIDTEIETIDAGTVVYVAVDGELSGLISLEDVIRDDSAYTVHGLRELGVEIVLATGDNRIVAERMAEKAGIDKVEPECLPEDKLKIIGELQSSGSKVCMVGDGINDAPALKKADVGIAMGGVGSDIAIEASDITLMNDDIRQLPHIFGLSRKMMSTIRFNLTVSMVLNFTAVILAAMALLDPISGAIVHNVGSVFVVVNSALLLRWGSKQKCSERNGDRDDGQSSIVKGRTYGILQHHDANCE